MLIQLKCYGALRDAIMNQDSGNSMEMDVPENTSVADLMKKLSVDTSLLRVFMDGITITDYETKISDRSEIVLLIPTTGG